MHQINHKNRLVETYSLILLDMVSVTFAYLLAIFLRFGRIGQFFRMEVHYTVWGFLMLFCVLYSVMTEWNRGFFTRGYMVEFIAILKYNIVMAAAIGCLLFLVKIANDFSRLIFGYFLIGNVLITYVLHILFKRYMLYFYRNSRSSDKVLIVTQNNCAESLIKRVLRDKAWNYQITAVALVDVDRVRDSICGIPVVANGSNLFEVATQMILDEVFIYLPDADKRTIKETIVDFETMGITCHYNVEMEELNLEGKTAGKFAGFAVMTFSLQYLDYRRVMVKRLIDIVGALIGLLITAALFPFVAIAIKLDSKGPVLFSQIRIGKNGRRIKIYKFRSMYTDAERQKKRLETQNEMQGPMFKIEHDPRITRVGRILRKTSIDELPQFYNVLKGDMSLVGTRPPTEDEFEQYNLHYRRRLCITPGLTGMWQVHGRGRVTDFDEVMKYDLQYIDNWSLLLDIKILIQTVFEVLLHRGT